ncbi:MAG: Era-like GTP-binding protein, partial [Pseudomonadota bacterium]
MENKNKVRLILILGICFLGLLVLAAFVFLADAGLSLWMELQRQSAVVRYSVITLFATLLLGLGFLVFRILMPKRKTHAEMPQQVSANDLAERLEGARSLGIDTRQAERELIELSQRRESGSLTVALMGEVSVGKSSLVRAFLPDAVLEVSVLGGSTAEVNRYEWVSSDGDSILISDLPGFNQVSGETEQLAIDEALRCHIVVFLCEGDLSRTEFEALKRLSDSEKPVILALNKVDSYTVEEVTQIRDVLKARMDSLFSEDMHDLVFISTRHNELDELRLALQRLIRVDVGLLEKLRDSAVFKLADKKLAEAKSEHAYVAGQALVSKYTGRAVVGALAAVAPGTDILIQGYLGTNLVRELCETFDAPVRELDIKRFLEICEQHIGRTTPMVLAIAGNGFKAFPGIGTLAGGLIHAAAYGLIFDSLGNSLLETLRRQGTLETLQATALFKEKLSEDLEK